MSVRHVVGIGARRGVSAEAVRAALAVVRDAIGAGSELVYASAEAKAAERGILDAIAPARLEVRPAAALAAVAVPGSMRVDEAVGTPSVAEAAALLVAGEQGRKPRLVLPKTIVGDVTVAAARVEHTPLTSGNCPSG
ncbi:cobalamin biosynthesis protein [Pseudonocardia sp. RS11V-5]|uniref:cobalamin biosynthesis protein n=1 Tax=Pseudonocardia terrae TaxID=2905831 RepID=UPI001E2A7459|nr:cobalamin biosynthesis protein [Pseudonocardia terrae]MCE3552090.1 cobalamin biosynthesis protein [Pseudonocardia terrae]